MSKQSALFTLLILSLMILPMPVFAETLKITLETGVQTTSSNYVEVEENDVLMWSVTNTSRNVLTFHIFPKPRAHCETVYPVRSISVSPGLTTNTSEVVNEENFPHINGGCKIGLSGESGDATLEILRVD
jgi:hypothetical protein